MTKQLWGLVALFAGIVVMLALWLMMAEGPTTTPPAGEPSAQAPPKLGTPRIMKKAEGLQMNAERARINVRGLAARHKRMQEAQGNGGTLPPPPTESPEGVFPLDQNGIAAAVAERKEDMQACYETALFHTPGISGKMTLVLRIEPEPGQDWGRVDSVDSDSTLDATVLEGCITTVFEELRFDAREPVTIRYPVSFLVADEAD